jgi:hypothetical protein
MNAVRAGSIAAHVLVLAACSGAAPSVIEQPGDGGTGTSDGGHGGVDATGGTDGPISGDDGPVSGGDASVHDSGGACAPSPPSGSACNSLTPPPPAITIQCNTTEQVPAPTGGVIRDGTYVMTSATYYAAGGACQTPEVDGVTWDICGSSWQIAQTVTVSGQTPQTLIGNATVIPTGSTLNITLTCGLTSQPITFAYDATPTTLRLHTGGTATTGRVDTFMRQ